MNLAVRLTHTNRYRLLSLQIRTHLLQPSHLPTLLRALRAALFPNNALAPARPTPDAASIVAVKRRAAEALVDTFPPEFAKRYFGSDGAPADHRDHGETGDDHHDDPAADAAAVAAQRRITNAVLVARAEALLDPFADAYLNKHLLFGVLELVLVRLMPELAERGVQSLLTERLGDADAD